MDKELSQLKEFLLRDKSNEVGGKVELIITVRSCSWKLWHKLQSKAESKEGPSVKEKEAYSNFQSV